MTAAEAPAPQPPGRPRGPTRGIRSALSRHRALVVAPTALLVAVVATALGAGSADSQRPGRTPPPQGVRLAAVRAPAPTFTRPLLTGTGRAGVSSHPGRVTVLTFWSSWCVACRSEAAMLARVSTRYQRSGVRFLGIDDRDRPSAARSFAHKYDVGYASVVDPDGSILAAYGGVGLPGTFVLDRDGTVRFAAAGTPDPASLREALDRLLRRPD